ncbi:MAG: TonB-dependent receptor [Sulfuricurvum sp.]|uniref:TonB-dependent receptor n=1 Tax=Sulfuricurvum sp. TaxID=2025608 RepID=UPI002634C268|nr:TonB-dependent receptor [Sulfuricurvum sp.]MDD2830234.1 TonB-dependent receptor [Sulfuricurvum sp.]MDD4948808.1 TonB-dependent receptor [Sulfuricurvum sp.]
MKPSIFFLSLAACAVLTANPLGIERIVVTDTFDDGDTMITDSNRSSANQTFSTKSIATLSTQANMNPYSVIAYSPSVNFTPVDQAGSNEPSYHDPIRIRGKSQSGPGGVFMVDGMPISSNPGGGKQLMDMENVSSIDLLKGYLPVDKNLGFSSLIGKVDMNLKEAKNTLGAEVSQSFGSNDFKRTFVRIDSSKIGDVAVFGSFSDLSNDKTKGSGELKRLNATVGLTYTPTNALKTKITAIRNSDDHHNYYNLSFADTTNLSANFNKEYGTSKPTSSNDVNYYDWNKQSFDTTAVLGEIEYKPTSNDTITIKPYYKKDKGDYWYSNASSDGNVSKNRVINWQIDHDLYGATASFDHTFSEALKTKIGYWYHKQLPPGPPSDQEKYKVLNGSLVYDGYGVLSDNAYHVLHAPFGEVSGAIAHFNYVAGLQYQSFKIGSLQSHTLNTSATTSSDYDTALATTAVDSWASVNDKIFHTFIPSLYLGYALSPSTSAYIDYSRTYGFDVNLFPTYVSNRANFVAKNVTLQQLWDKLDLELSNNIDFGVKTTIGAVTLNPSLFVSFVQNKQANIYDPQYGVSYPANIGDALGYGAEFSAYGPINENFEFLLGLSYNRYQFTQNFQSGATTTVDTDGKQLPDAPQYMAKAALSYMLGDWTLTPSLRYTSSRWGDVQNTQKVDAYTLVDFDVAYRMAQFMGSRNAIFRLTATNLTNEKYIATINAADNALAASATASTYQTGEPFGLFASINLKF